MENCRTKITLEEAIAHLRDVLDDDYHEWNCAECKAEHEQLLMWLEELKARRAMDGCI